tara:strand:+ start:557 stop:2218 length:1662 start_codon:yes stop_codon:yes gene_type:complete
MFMSKSLFSFVSGGHDSNLSVYVNNTLYTVELERIYGNRYLGITALSGEQQLAFFLVLKEILKNKGVLPLFFDIGLFDWQTPPNIVQKFCDFFNIKEVHQEGDDVTFHHKAHAASAFYSSGFDEALVFSYDGGGNDGTFCVFDLQKPNPDFTQVNARCDSAFTTKYCSLSSFIKEIRGPRKKNEHLHRRFDQIDHGGSGKLMGLSAYGSFDESIFNLCKKWLQSDSSQPFDFNFWGNFSHDHLNNLPSLYGSLVAEHVHDGIEGPLSYDWAFNMQRAFEADFLERFASFFDERKHKNVCLTGGGALNVVLNDRLSKIYPNVNFFVPSSPGDSGLSYGMIARYLKDALVPEVMYTGCEILDKEVLPYILDHRPWKKASPSLIAKELTKGKIIGVCRGDSETGPRALGNRSILADPRSHQAKDVINHKVKFREWYRPFAPVCKEDKVSIFFETSDNASYKYMSFSPQVREKYQTVLPAVTHVDGSSRLQTVSGQQNQFIYNILDEFEKLTGLPVLVNTSFNTKGKAILTRYLTAMQVLDSTELDGVVLEDYYIYK